MAQEQLAQELDAKAPLPEDPVTTEGAARPAEEKAPPAESGDTSVEASAPPAEGEVVVITKSADACIKYVDFHPAIQVPAKQAKKGQPISMAIFQRFDALVTKANAWLKQNPQCVVTNCESLEVRVPNSLQGSTINTDQSLHTALGVKGDMVHTRILRLWVSTPVLMAGETPQAQQIGFKSFAPSCLDEGTSYVPPTFSGLDDILAEVNGGDKLPGRILNVETLDYKFHKWPGTIDVDQASFMDQGKPKTVFLYFLRLFYIVGGDHPKETIEITDFPPENAAGGAGSMSGARYETFPQQISKATTWTQMQPDSTRVISSQGYEMRVHMTWKGSDLDTRNACFIEEDKNKTGYLRIIRVYHASLEDGSSYPDHKPLILNYKQFPPMMTAAGKPSDSRLPLFESLPVTLQRAQAWANVSNINIIGAETIPLRASGTNQLALHDNSFFYAKPHSMDFTLYVIRLIIDGIYVEPPAETQPPPPTVKKSKGCTIL